MQFDPLPEQQRIISRKIGVVAEILEPPPKRNAGEWADERRVLPPDAPEPGPWRTDRVPFWKPIYQAFSDTETQLIVVCCGAQMSKTEALFNIMAHRLDEGPYAPVLYIGPTEKLVKSMAADRWKKVLQSTPRLWKRLAKGQLWKTTEQFISGTRCGWAWAGSASELAGHPAGLVLIDERSRMSGDVGGEGDPVSLGRARTKNYSHRKIGVMSTPTVEGVDPTWALLDDAFAQFWSWQCLHCREFFVPELALLWWPKDCTPAQAMTDARMNCPKCGGQHQTADKVRMNAAGQYFPYRRKEDTEDALGADVVLGRYLPAAPDPKNPTKGFWIPGPASPWASFGDIAAVLIQAYRSNNDQKIQAEVNTWGGQCYRVKGEAPAWNEVQQRRLHYGRGAIQQGVQMLTQGIDVQKDGLYYVCRGWGYKMESWLLDEGFIPGPTDFDEVWIKAGELVQSSYGDMRAARVFVDSGYRPGDEVRRPDHAVYTFARLFPGLVYPTKGHDTQEKPIRWNDIDYNLGGQVVKGGVRLYHLDTDYFKRWLHSRIRWPADQPGGWHVHQEVSESYCRQMVAEEMVVKASGRHVWVRTSRHNHFLDCEVNATAAAIVQGVEKLPAPTASPPALANHSARPNVAPGFERRGF